MKERKLFDRIILFVVLIFFLTLPACRQAIRTQPPPPSPGTTLASKIPKTDKKEADHPKEEAGKKGEIETNSDQYIIGPEDMLYIYVWREENLSKTVPVRMDGRISLPLIDDIQADGLTPLQLKELLTNRLKAVIDNPTVSVTVMEANSFKIYVLGEVKTPGVLRIRSETTFLELISMVGGFTEWADQKKILVIRKEKGASKRFYVNYKKIIDGKEPNIDMQRGDTVVVE
jgi:polysaccharide export outer membrane protein